MELIKVHRHALGLLAAVAVTGGIVAAPVAGSANAESVSLNAGVVDQSTARDASSDRRAGEEMPARDLSVATGSRHGAHAAGNLAGSVE